MEFALIAVKAMLENKFRTVLTLLGIIIGIASVITVFSVGYGAKADIGKTIASFGSNLMWIYPARFVDKTGRVKKTAVREMDMDDIEFLELVDGVEAVSPMISDQTDIEFGDITERCSINGTVPGYLEVRSESVEKGRFVDENDIKNYRQVCVITRDVRDTFFTDEEPVGKTMKISGTRYTVIGVMADKDGGQLIGGRKNLEIFVPITTLQRQAGLKYISYAFFKRRPDMPFETLINKLRNVFIARSSFTTNYEVRSLEKEQVKIDKVLNTLTTVIVFIAGISLLVGGIGVMNIMLFTVTERTREIGIRKAVGASRRDILIQFLIESVILTLSGGVIGIILGSLLSMLIAVFAKWPAIIPFSAVAIAVSTSVVTGIVFGIYPANKAARMDPIEALRYE